VEVCSFCELVPASRRLLQRSTFANIPHARTVERVETVSLKETKRGVLSTCSYIALPTVSFEAHFWYYKTSEDTRMSSMLYQRKQALPLILILILVLSAQATTIAAFRVLREKSRPQAGGSASLTSSMPGASGCTFDPNNPGGRCPHPWRFLQGMYSFDTMFFYSFFPIQCSFGCSSGAQTEGSGHI